MPGLIENLRIPDLQQGIRSKAPRSDDWGVWSNTPQGGAIEGNAADDALMVVQGNLCKLDSLTQRAYSVSA